MLGISQAKKSAIAVSLCPDDYDFKRCHRHSVILLKILLPSTLNTIVKEVDRGENSLSGFLTSEKSKGWGGVGGVGGWGRSLTPHTPHTPHTPPPTLCVRNPGLLSTSLTLVFYSNYFCSQTDIEPPGHGKFPHPSLLV
ncbi:hypothetical protein [Nostoc sp.]|uniref:hypothetical protein n=1 Tax=Nostoc sp. TaxID=1180 RepID=UPI002FF4A779